MEATTIPTIGSLADHEARLRKIELEDAERKVRVEESERATKADITRLEKKIDSLTRWIGSGVVVFAAAALPVIFNHV